MSIYEEHEATATILQAAIKYAKDPTDSNRQAMERAAVEFTEVVGSQYDLEEIL